MRVILTLAVLVVCLSLVGCARHHQAAYAKPQPPPLPHPTKASSVKPDPLPVRQSPVLTRATTTEPPPPPVEKLPVPTRTTSVKPTPLPPKSPRSPGAAVDPPVTAEAKFKAAQEKAKLTGVDTLTQEDIDGLSYEQIKELRGY